MRTVCLRGEEGKVGGHINPDVLATVTFPPHAFVISELNLCVSRSRTEENEPKVISLLIERRHNTGPNIVYAEIRVCSVKPLIT